MSVSFLPALTGIGVLERIPKGYALFVSSTTFDYTSKESFEKTINNLLNLTDEQIKAISDYKKAQSGGGLHLKKYNLPYLETKIEYLSLFGEEYQNKIMEVKSQLNDLNEEVDQARFYLNKTFESISPENYNIISNNLTDSYGNIAKKSQHIADLIGKLAF